MENNKCFNKKASYFIAGALVITIFDSLILLSISVRMIIYITKGEWLAPIIQVIPMVGLIILLTFEYIFILSFFKRKRKLKIPMDNQMTILYEIETANPKKFKIELILFYFSYVFLTLMGGLGIIPLVFMIKGHKAYQNWKSINQKVIKKNVIE